MHDDDEKRPSGFRIGDDLSRMSVEDLAELKAELETEIARIDQDIEEKRKSKLGAESIFREV